MHITQQQEQFSNAYLRAVATVAECTLAKPDVDDDSIDFTVSSKGFTGVYTRPKLDIQLKCHMRDSHIDTGGFSYPLKKKNYDELRPSNILVPRFLVVVVVPNDVTTWLHQSDMQTLIKYCSYWESLRGKPPSQNRTSISVYLPQENQLTASSLRDLLQVIASGGAP